MTLRERNLIIAQLEKLQTVLTTSQVHVTSPDEFLELFRAITIMKRQPLSSPGLPVSAGGDPEEPRYCVECGAPVLGSQLTCRNKACVQSARAGFKR